MILNNIFGPTIVKYQQYNKKIISQLIKFLGDKDNDFLPLFQDRIVDIGQNFAVIGVHQRIPTHAPARPPGVADLNIRHSSHRAITHSNHSMVNIGATGIIRNDTRVIMLKYRRTATNGNCYRLLIYSRLKKIHIKLTHNIQYIIERKRNLKRIYGAIYIIIKRYRHWNQGKATASASCCRPVVQLHVRVGCLQRDAANRRDPVGHPVLPASSTAVVSLVAGYNVLFREGVEHAVLQVVGRLQSSDGREGIAATAGALVLDRVQERTLELTRVVGIRRLLSPVHLEGY